MPVVAVVNRKGGSGKSTLATHLAAWLARRGTPVMLGDVDRQQSTVPWLRRREAHALPGAPIVGWAVDPRNVLRPPAGVAHVMLDTPGGLQGFDLSRLLMYADAVLMPVGHSAFEREAAAACLAEMRTHPRVASGRVRVAALGVRIDSRTRAEQELRDWAEQLDLPFLGVLRAAQTYVRCADRGLTVFDLAEPAAQVDLEQWQPVLDWLAPVVDGPAPKPVLRPPRLVAAAERAAETAPTASAGPATPAGATMSAAASAPALPRQSPPQLTHAHPAPARASAAPIAVSPPVVERGAWAGMRRLLGRLVPRPQRSAA